MDLDCYHSRLRDEIRMLSQIGFCLQTFIPSELDSEHYPKLDGMGNVVKSKKTEKPEPKFCGKNPSFWDEYGKPILAKPNKPCSLEEALQRIDNADRLEKPIGIGVIPQQSVVVIDIDMKCYQSSEEMHEDIERYALKSLFNSTRVESTPGGGYHIYLKVKNMAEWELLNGGFHCNFSTHPAGPHRGEILTGGNRFCASAPSKRFDGIYKVVNLEYANKLVEIDCLSDISIYPIVQKKKNQREARIFVNNTKDAIPQQLQMRVGTVEQLSQLLSEKAQQVLKGDKPYTANDRSGTLAAFGNELFSWNNLATLYDYDFTAALHSLWNDAVAAHSAEDKNDRVFNTLNLEACFQPDEWAAKRFTKVMKSASLEAIPLNTRSAAYQAARNICDEMDDMSVQEALTELIRLTSADRIDAKALLPPWLSDALSILGETVQYDWEVILSVLMAAISGACPLDSKIELIAGDFIQPLTIWVMLLMPTGELKTPLIKRLVLDPWMRSVNVVMNKRFQDAMKEWTRQKSEVSSNGGEFDMPKPRKAHTIITEDRTSQGIERHFVLHESFAKGSILLLLDEAKEVLLEMSGQAKGNCTLPFGTFVLSRYDGTGASGAKADEQNERHYSQCRLAALFCCQPDVYRDITGDVDQTGLAARFVAIEQTKVDQKFPTTFPASHCERHQKLNQILSDLYGWVSRQSSIHLKLTEDALALFQMDRKNLQDRKNQTLNDAERGQINKCYGRIGRLAGILHLMWAFNPEQPLSNFLDTNVGKDSMERAIRLNRFLLSQTVLIRQTSTGNSLSMQKIYTFQNNALKVKKAFRITDLRTKPVSTMRLSSTDAVTVANALQELGYGRVSTDDKGKLCYLAIKALNA